MIAGDNKEAAVKALVDGGALRALSKALESGAGAEKTAQLVAEIAKIGELFSPAQWIYRDTDHRKTRKRRVWGELRKPKSVTERKSSA